MKQSAITGSLGNLGDRFVMSGYKKSIPFLEKVKTLRAIEGLSGIEVSSDPESDESDARTTKKILDDYGFSCACVGMEIASKAAFGRGSLGNPDPAVRKCAIDACKRASDHAMALGAEVINIWPGQDGFDYAFCTDYRKLYDDFLRGAVEVADYNRDIKVALEFKPREPRNRSLLDNCASTLLMCAEANRENLGVTVDVGHVLYANANMAAAAEMCLARGKLFHIHTNDCLGYWDDDMVVGAVHFIEYIELCYVLRKYGYAGWCSVDIFPNREDALGCVRESVMYMALFDAMVDKIGVAEIEKCIQKGDAANVSRVIREKVLWA